ncbi:Integrin alpha-9 [Nymphon striatum]|nr:Integrin alpha-9 [Nymphon striatum]
MVLPLFEGGIGALIGTDLLLGRAIIAAPKANSAIMPSEVIKPGVVYKCDLKNPSCSEIAFDTSGNKKTQNTGDANFHYRDLKDNMFLGGSIDSGHGNLIACAHLWKNQLHSKIYLSNGLCYIINENLEIRTVRRIIPLLNRKKQAPDRSYYYAFGVAGISSAFTKAGLLLGAPGISNFIGSNVYYEIDKPASPYVINNAIVPNVLRDVGINSYFELLNDISQALQLCFHFIHSFLFSKFGTLERYSVSSGMFYDKEVYFVSGAPKEKETGRVFIYMAYEFNNDINTMAIKESKRGEQLGEYFGSTICVTNLNNDQFDDLLVASPFYSSNSIGDHGKVYVYVSDGKGLKAQNTLFGSSSPGARFGSAISAIGDLNQDGYNDVVIGAPYEKGIGAVYIYHGSEKGIKPSYSQRILASEISSDLKGFGISIARGDDIDNNKYNDLLVGSYLSQQAVLLRTHPVIEVSASIKFDVPFLDLNSTKCSHEGVSRPCFNAEVCFSYTGKHVPSALDFNLVFEMETLRKASKQDSRGYMLDLGWKMVRSEYEQKAIHNQNTCKKFEVHIYKASKDIITPVQFQLTYNLTKPVTDVFHQFLPILDTSQGNSVTNQLLLQTNCGADGLCSADLELKLKILGMEKIQSLIIGEQKDITISATVKNKNETAIHSFVRLEFQNEVDFRNLGTCEIVHGVSENVLKYTKKVLNCKTVPLLDKGVEETFLVKLGIIGFKPKSQLIINGTAFTRSSEKNLANNGALLSLPVIASADITIRGITENNQIAYEGDKFEKKEVVSATHMYENKMVKRCQWEMEKNIEYVESVPQNSATLLDGMAVVQKLKIDQSNTFGDIAQKFSASISQAGFASKRIDVVFDIYIENSIKNAERVRRGTSSLQFGTLLDNSKVKQWKNFLSSSTGNKSRIISIDDVSSQANIQANKLGVSNGEYKRSLLGVYCFTGCDTVSAFAGKGKLKALKLLQEEREFVAAFSRLGLSWDVDNNLVNELQKFVCRLYGQKQSTVNELRYKMYYSKNGKVKSEQLPPCHNALKQHILRCNYQARIWRLAFENNPVYPEIHDHGWYLENQAIKIRWMTCQPAPNEVLSLLSCSCKRTCQPTKCSCIDNRMHCTDLCSCGECQNKFLATTESSDSGGESDSDFEDIEFIVTHHFSEVSKSNFSPVKTVKVTLTFPYASDEDDPVIRFKSVDVDDDSSSVSGTCDTRALPFVQDKKPPGDDDDDDDGDSVIYDRGSKSAKLSSEIGAPEQKLEGKARERRDISAVEEKTKKKKKTSVQLADVIVNCTNAKCIAFECYLGPFLDNFKTGKIFVAFEINVTSVLALPYLKKEDTIGIQTSGNVIIKDKGITVTTPQLPKTDYVLTTLLSTKIPKNKPVDLWIIIVSAIAGVLVLLIILFVLIKVGFFKRTAKEDMEKLKAKAETAEWEKLMVG